MRFESDYKEIFEWDEEKALINMKKHGVDFKLAVEVFSDDNRLLLYDAAHSEYEDRWITIGMTSERVLLLVVIHTFRGDATRIISARKATKEERRKYNDRENDA